MSNENPLHDTFNTTEGREWLKSMLRMGPVDVTFTKSDGTQRVMKCTLQEGVVVPHEKTTDRVKETNDNVLPVWDLEKNAWRSFRLDSITQVNFTI